MFHITVGVAPRSTPDLSREAEILKAAVLYGDKVKFCSPASSLMAQLVMLGEFGKQATDRERAELFDRVFGGVLDAKAESPEHARQLRAGVQQYKELLGKKHLSRDRILAREQLRHKVRKLWTALATTVQDLGERAGLSDILLAAESGIVELELFQTESQGPDTVRDEMLRQFIEAVNAAVVGGDSYPLLDEFMGGLVQAQIKAGRLTVTAPHVGRARHVGFASSLFERLPLFDRASLREVLQIRQELDTPLSHFRGPCFLFRSRSHRRRGTTTFQ